MRRGVNRWMKREEEWTVEKRSGGTAERGGAERCEEE